MRACPRASGGKSWNTRLELALAYLLEADQGEVVFRSGLDSRFTDHETAGFSLAGANFRISTDDDSSVHNAYVGASLRYRLDERLHVEAELEYSHDRGEVSERSVSGRVLVGVEF